MSRHRGTTARRRREQGPATREGRRWWLAPAWEGKEEGCGARALRARDDGNNSITGDVLGTTQGRRSKGVEWPTARGRARVRGERVRARGDCACEREKWIGGREWLRGRDGIEAPGAKRASGGGGNEQGRERARSVDARVMGGAFWALGRPWAAEMDGLGGSGALGGPAGLDWGLYSLSLVTESKKRKDRQGKKRTR